ncbi:MAG: glycosyltransferase, partial [Blastocatellia bacterium]
LRPVKDPFRAAMAARLLPKSSRIQIVHAGGAMSGAMIDRACRETQINPRYRWLGEEPAWRARKLLMSSQLLVHSSRLEGGANVISEAIVAGTPIVASRIAGNTGLLGEDYPGYFKLGDARDLARVILRAESDHRFLAELKSHCAKRAALFDPASERRAWMDLLDEIVREFD